jgi:hypothetical protein
MNSTVLGSRAFTVRTCVHTFKATYDDLHVHVLDPPRGTPGSDVLRHYSRVHVVNTHQLGCREARHFAAAKPGLLRRALPSS